MKEGVSYARGIEILIDVIDQVLWREGEGKSKVGEDMH